MAEPTLEGEHAMKSSTNAKWYAIYTNYNAEQTLDGCIKNFSKQHELDYETYLPLQAETKRWQDRTKVVKKPLFRNYLFVKHDDNAFSKVKNMKGFCSYVRTGIKPSVIPTPQMDIIKKVASYQTGSMVELKALTKGKKVKVCRGAFAGYEGVLMENQNNKQLAIEIKSLKLYVSVLLPAGDVVLIS